VLRRNLGNQRPDFAWQSGDGSWHEEKNWFSKKIPNGASSARISRGAKVEITQAAAAGELFIGTADLHIKKSSLQIEGLLGDLDVGFRPNGSRINIFDGNLKIAGRLILRKQTSLSQSGGSVKIAGGLFFLDGHTFLQLSAKPSAKFLCRNWYGMQESDQLELVSSEHTFPQLVVENVVQIGGTLKIQSDRLTTLPDILLLLDNRGKHPVQGCFSNLAEGQSIEIHGVRYRMTYLYSHKGPEKNDIALVRSK